MVGKIADDLAALLQDPPGSIPDLIDAISPAIYEKLKSGIELGKWEDGRRLEKAQLEQCMQLLILYEAQKLPETERTGADLKKDCQSAGEQGTSPDDQVSVITIMGGE